MRLRLVMLMAAGLAVGLAPGAEGPKENQAAKDLQQFQGTWTLESVEVNGMKIDAETLKKAGHEITLIVKEDKVTLKLKRDDVEGTLKLDPTKRPKAYDTKGTDPEGQTHEAVGIYKFEGDELVIALTVGEGKDLPRPTEFKPSTIAGKRQMVVVVHLKRK